MKKSDPNRESAVSSSRRYLGSNGPMHDNTCIRYYLAPAKLIRQLNPIDNFNGDVNPPPLVPIRCYKVTAMAFISGSPRPKINNFPPGFQQPKRAILAVNHLFGAGLGLSPFSGSPALVAVALV